MRNFSAPFATAKNKKASQPVNLLQIDWPIVNGSPAFTVRLSDRALNIDGTGWLAGVADWGTLEDGSSQEEETRLTPYRKELAGLVKRIEKAVAPKRAPRKASGVRKKVAAEGSAKAEPAETEAKTRAQPAA